MKEQQKIIKINNQEYTRNELLDWCKGRISQEGLSDYYFAFYTFILDWFSDNESITFQTSGSTGLPKTIVFAKSMVRASARLSMETFDLKQGDNALLALSTKYIAGALMVIRAFEGGLNLITLEPQSSFTNDTIQDIDFAALVPLQVRKLLSVKNPVNIEKLIIGGGQISSDLEDEILQKFSGKAWETYGMTETLTHVAIRNIKEGETHFHALRGVKFQRGEKNNLEISAEHLMNSSIITNDVVDLVSETTFKWIGRSDNIINSGGIKIQPEPIEKLIFEKSGIVGYLSYVSDNQIGQRVILVMEKKPDSELMEQIFQELPNYYRPKRILLIEVFPLTPSGKIDRKKLQEIAFLKMGSSV